MINLIKNELNKIFHKKGLFIIGVIAFIFPFISFIMTLLTPSYDSEDEEAIKSQYNICKDLLEDYNLNDINEVKEYAEYYAHCETLKLQLDYADFESPEHYFIGNDIEPVLMNMYYAKFVTKNQYEYDIHYEDYQKLLLKLENFDWKDELEKEKQQYLEEKKVLESSLNGSNINADDIKLQIKILDVNISAVDYRLEYEIPYAQSEASMMIEEYVTNGVSYFTLEADKSIEEDKNLLQQYRLVKEDYEVYKYKLENGIIEGSTRSDLSMVILSMFNYPDMVILLAMFIIISSVIADEFNNGTIKQLLIKPFTRNEILISKILASFVATMIFALGYFAIYIFFYCWSYEDFGILLSNYIVYDFSSEKILSLHFIVYCLINLISILPQYLIIFFFAFFACVLTTNSAAPMTAGMGLVIGAEMVSYYLSDKVLAYLPFGCWDFSTYLFGGFSLNKYASLPLSLIVCFITLVVLIALSFLIFKRKDIKNQ